MAYYFRQGDSPAFLHPLCKQAIRFVASLVGGEIVAALEVNQVDFVRQPGRNTPLQAVTGRSYRLPWIVVRGGRRSTATLLRQYLGRPIEEIGDLDQSHTL